MQAVKVSAVSVGQYATLIGRALRHVGGAVVEGEVQQPRESGRGLLYFDLTDGEAKLPCKVFGSSVRRLEHRPAHGDLVQVVVDRPDLWPAAGKLDLIVSQVRLAGEGELLRRRRELLARLRADGLCDPARRKPLPEFPRAVGVIAGRGSDGLSDVVRALRDRFPPVHVVTCTALVQGAAAPVDLIDALARLQDHPLVDVIVIARGGGSVHDLVAFDDERLCRAIFACDKPVITAIGHTDNSPVCNEVAWPGCTPSRSAELAVPSVAELGQGLRLAAGAVERVPVRMDDWRQRVAAAGERVRIGRSLDARAGAIRERSAAIDAHAAAFFVDRAAALAEAGRVLAHSPALVRGIRAEVEEQGRRVRVAIRRQVADHERDYGRAFARLGREARGGVLRHIARELEVVARDGELLAERVRRGVGDARRELRHFAAVVEAHDLRRRGWLLAATPDGRPVQSVALLRAGQRLLLNFRDGDVAALAQSIDPHEEAL